MPRDGSDNYTIPAGTHGAPDTPIESAKYNAFVDDVAFDLNHPRPIIAGGTGAASANDALYTLTAEKAGQVVVNFDSQIWIAGSFYAAGSATASPVAGHAFVGIVYISDPAPIPPALPANANLVVEARDQNDSNVPGRLYVREKKAGVWGAWKLDSRTLIGDAEGIGGETADMFFGLRGTAPNSRFVVNSESDVSGTDLLTVSKAGVLRANGAIPAGAIMDFAMPTPPVGWLACDGTSHPTASYPDLFNAIGYTWGGSGANFNVPPFSDRFRRNRGAAAGAVGALQTPKNLAHTHRVQGRSAAETANHTHHFDFMSQAADRSLDHLHGDIPFMGTITSGGYISAPGWVYVNSTAKQSTGGMDRSIDHLHRIVGDTGFVSALHQHDFDVISFGGSADDASEARPLSATVLTCIKV